MIYSHWHRRRRWYPNQIRLERALVILKSVCTNCWNELEPEETGWMEPHEARICLARILETLQQHTHTIAHLIAPSVDADAATIIALAGGSSSPSSQPSASSSSSSSHQSEVEADLRNLLQKLFSDLARREVLETEFPYFLDHIDARPAQPLHSFTPPVGTAITNASNHMTVPQRKPSSHSPGSRAHSHQHPSHPTAPPVNASVASTSSSSSPTRSQLGANSVSPASVDEKSPLPVSSPPSQPTTRSGSRAGSRAADTMDRKIFRFEFNTAVVGWIEAQIIKRMYVTDPNIHTAQA